MSPRLAPLFLALVFCLAPPAAVDAQQTDKVYRIGLAMDAASIDDIVADLRQAGIAVARGPIKRRDGMALFVHDPDGVRVELQLKHTPAS